MSILIQQDKCNGCGLCARSCPYQALEMLDKKATWLEDRCTLCGACLESCKVGALSGEIPTREAPDFKEYRGVWVFVERQGSGFHRSAFELIGCARGLADSLGEKVSAIVFGADSDDKGLNELISRGADSCIVVYNRALAQYRTCSYTHALSHLIIKYLPSILLIPATTIGRDLAPRLARRLKLGLTADCTRLAIDPQEHVLLQTRPAFGGNIMATIVTRYSRPQTATVRPGVMKPLDLDPTRKGDIIFEEINLPDSVDVIKILECVMNTESSSNLSQAAIIVAGGRPICGEKGMSVLKEFAEAIGAEVACTRVVVEEGFMSTDRQVGQTGQTVRPEIYFACGISGAIQHRAGMDGSRYIVAINKDPDAPIFEVADLAVVGDIYQILPVLTRTIKDYKGLSTPC